MAERPHGMIPIKVCPALHLAPCTLSFVTSIAMVGWREQRTTVLHADADVQTDINASDSLLAPTPGLVHNRPTDAADAAFGPTSASAAVHALSDNLRRPQASSCTILRFPPEVLDAVVTNYFDTWGELEPIPHICQYFRSVTMQPKYWTKIYVGEGLYKPSRLPHALSAKTKAYLQRSGSLPLRVSLWYDADNDRLEFRDFLRLVRMVIGADGCYMRRWESLEVDLRELSASQERRIEEFDFDYPTPLLKHIAMNSSVPSAVTNIISGAANPCLLALWIDEDTTLEETAYGKVQCLRFLGGSPEPTLEHLRQFHKLDMLVLSGEQNPLVDENELENEDSLQLDVPVELSKVVDLVVSDLSMGPILENTKFPVLSRLLIELEFGYQVYRHPGLIQSLRGHLGTVVALDLQGVILDPTDWDMFFDAAPMLSILKAQGCSPFKHSLKGASRCQQLLMFDFDRITVARMFVMRLYEHTAMSSGLTIPPHLFTL